jgi:ribosomal protein S18 acetylase RimI-like enzyme
MLTMTPATAADTDSVIAVLMNAVQWLHSRGLPTWNPNTLPYVMEPLIARGEVYLARINDQPVGTVTVQWSDPAFWGERPDDAGYIHKLAIMRSVAGQQIGAQMVSWAESLIMQHGRPYARLDCHAENPAINRFYQSAGYQVRGIVTVHGVPLNLYEKPLG